MEKYILIFAMTVIHFIKFTYIYYFLKENIKDGKKIFKTILIFISNSTTQTLHMHIFYIIKIILNLLIGFPPPIL